MLIYSKTIDDDLSMFVIQQRGGEVSACVFSSSLGRVGSNREYFSDEDDAVEWVDTAIDSDLWKKYSPYKVL